MPRRRARFDLVHYLQVLYISVSLSLHHPVLVKTVITDSGTPVAVLQREVEGVPLGSSADGRPWHRARARVTL